MAAMLLPVVLTMASARATLEQLEPALGAEGEPIIDASRLAELDTSAIAVLLHCQRVVAESGRRLRVTGAPAKLAALAALYGVKDLLGLAEAS